METQWGAWTPSDRNKRNDRTASPTESLPPGHIADLITWIALSPGEMVLNEVTVTPLLEKGWP